MLIKKTKTYILGFTCFGVSAFSFSFWKMEGPIRYIFEATPMKEKKEQKSFFDLFEYADEGLAGKQEKESQILKSQDGIYKLISNDQLYDNLDNKNITADFAFLYNDQAEFSIVTNSIGNQHKGGGWGLTRESIEQARREHNNSKPQIRFLAGNYQHQEDFWTEGKKFYDHYQFYSVNFVPKQEKKEESDDTLFDIKEIIKKRENRFSLQESLDFLEGVKIINSRQGSIIVDINNTGTDIQSFLIDHYKTKIGQENTSVEKWNIKLLKECEILTVWTVNTQAEKSSFITKIAGLAVDQNKQLFHWVTKLEN